MIRVTHIAQRFRSSCPFDNLQGGAKGVSGYGSGGAAREAKVSQASFKGLAQISVERRLIQSARLLPDLTDNLRAPSSRSQRTQSPHCGHRVSATPTCDFLVNSAESSVHAGPRRCLLCCCVGSMRGVGAAACRCRPPAARPPLAEAMVCHVTIVDLGSGRWPRWYNRFTADSQCKGIDSTHSLATAPA